MGYPTKVKEGTKPNIFMFMALKDLDVKYDLEIKCIAIDHDDKQGQQLNWYQSPAAHALDMDIIAQCRS